MAKILTNFNCEVKEVATVTVSAGADSADRVPSLNASGKLDITMIPTGVGATDAVSLPATEAISAGDFVNIYNASGTPSVRKADATALTKQAHRYVLAGVASGASATVYFDESNTSVTGQTAGDVWLSATTPGKTTTTAPSATGQIVHKLGVATSATSIHVNIQYPIELA